MSVSQPDRHHTSSLMLTTQVPVVEASDIQATVLCPSPSPYRGEYVILRIDHAEQGPEMLRRILPHVAPADEWWVPSLPGWLGIAFTFEGLKALGVPQASLDSFPIEFSSCRVPAASLLAYHVGLTSSRSSVASGVSNSSSASHKA